MMTSQSVVLFVEKFVPPALQPLLFRARLPPPDASRGVAPDNAPGVLLALLLGYLRHAGLTGDVAAPHELTVALPHHLARGCHVTAAATHGVAVVVVRR